MFSIAENFNNIKNKIINDTFLQDLSEVCNELGLINVSTDYDRINTSWAGFQIKNPNWKYFKIAFEFSSKNLQNL